MVSRTSEEQGRWRSCRPGGCRTVNPEAWPHLSRQLPGFIYREAALGEPSAFVHGLYLDYGMWTLGCPEETGPCADLL